MTEAPTLSESTDPYVLPVSEAIRLLSGALWNRVVYVGDSIAEGVREPLEGYRDLSWTDRVDEALSQGRPDFAALNLGRRNLLAAEIRTTQFEPALAFQPDLAFVIAGGNDMLRPGFDPEAVRADLAAMVTAFRAIGADVLLLGLFDITRAGLIPTEYAPAIRTTTRQLAELNTKLAAEHGGIFVGFADHPAGADPTIYASDRLHLNARGHAIAAADTIRALAAHAANTRPH